MDAFSRFQWLVPLETKRSKCIKKAFTRIYPVHGIPKCLESDNDHDFKKDIGKFCIKSKILRCHPFNPRAQGNVERSHHAFGQKILCDLMTNKKTGVNWVKGLPQYMKCYNHEKREELGWKSAFEIYYGRKPNELLNDWKSHDNNFHFTNTV